MIQSFTAGGAESTQVSASGAFFQYVECNALGQDERIKVVADGQDLGEYLPGDIIQLPATAGQWIITSRSPLTRAMVRIGTATAKTARIAGTVRVIDDNANASRNDRARVATADVTAAAGKFAAAGVWNPANSGETMQVDEIAITSAAPATIRFCELSAILTGPTFTPQSKKFDGATPVQQGISEELTNAFDPRTTVFYRGVNVTSMTKIFKTPLIIPPGMGIVVVSQSAATGLGVNIEWTV